MNESITAKEFNNCPKCKGDAFNATRIQLEEDLSTVVIDITCSRCNTSLYLVFTLIEYFEHTTGVLN